MHALLEDYLAAVAAHLRPLPTKWRDEELREMRTHLENAVIVNRELGQTEDEAAQAAVAQFGTPADLGENVVWAWRRGLALNKHSFWGAAACTAALTLLLTHLTPLLQSYLPPTPSRSFMQPPFSILLWVGWIIWLMPTFVLVGGISGFLFPRRAVAGVVLGLDAYLLYFLMGGSVAILTGEVSSHQPTHDDWYTLLMGFSTGVIFTLIAAGAAGTVSRLRPARGGRERLTRS